MRLGDDIHKLRPGTAVRVAPKTPRSHRNEGDEPVELWAISKQLGRHDATKLDDFWEASPGRRADALAARRGGMTASSCVRAQGADRQRRGAPGRRPSSTRPR